MTTRKISPTAYNGNYKKAVNEQHLTVTVIPSTAGSTQVISNKEKDFMILVEVRVVIVMLYDVDTPAEKFSAELFIEAKWLMNNEVDIGRLDESWRPIWNPELRVLNMLVEHKSEISYKIGEIDEKKYIFEVRRIKGTFYEKFLMHNYPFDVQKLNIHVYSACPITKCLLIKNVTKESSIVTDNFRGTQEWSLYNYVGVEENGKLSRKNIRVEDMEHSSINFYTVIARKPNYFFWNGFYLIFIISLISFGIFSVDYTLVHSRLHAMNELILTSVSFKWVINVKLPPISYLSILDIYSVASISYMSIMAVFHAVIGFEAEENHATSANDHLDTYVFAGSGGLFLLLNLLFFLYIVSYVYAPRRHYLRLERRFVEASKLKTKHTVRFY